MKKRCLSILLVLALCLMYMPVRSFAQNLIYTVPSDDFPTLEDAILAIVVLGDEDSYILNIGTDGQSYMTPIDFGNKTVTINLNGNSLTLGTITTNGELTINGPGTFTVATPDEISGGDNCKIVIQDGVTAAINSINMNGGSPSLAFTDSTLDIGSIIQYGDQTLTVSGCTGEIDTLQIVDGTPQEVALTDSTIQCGTLQWGNDSGSIRFAEGSVLTVTTQLNVNYNATPSDVFAFEDEDSKIIVKNVANNFFSVDHSDWFAEFLNTSGFMADHFEAAASGAGVVTVTNKDDIAGTPRDMTDVVLKGSIPDVTFPDDVSLFDTKEYTGDSQALFSDADVTEYGGTVIYYCLDADAPVWDAANPEETDIVEYNNAGYWIGGDAEHNDTTSTGTVSITAVPLSIEAKDVSILIGSGDAVPDETSADLYEVTGAVGTDVVTPVIQYQNQATGAVVASGDIAANAEGTYDIVISDYQITRGGADASGNYDVTTSNSTLRITDKPIAVYTTDPTDITLAYSGEPQGLSDAATDQGEILYKYDGGDWTTDLPEEQDAGTYDLQVMIRGTENEYEDSEPVTIRTTITPAPKVTVKAIDQTIKVGKALPDLEPVLGTNYEVEGLLGDDTLQQPPTLEYDGNPDNTAEGTYTILIFGAETTANYEGIEGYVEGTLTIEKNTGGGGGGGTEDPSENNPSYNFTSTDEGIGSYSEDPENWTWGERADLPKDVADFYKVLVENSMPEAYAPLVEGNTLKVTDPTGTLGSSQTAYTSIPGGASGHSISSFLAKDSTWELPLVDPDIPATPVDEVLVCQDDEPLYTANGDGKVDQTTFGNSNFFTVGVGTGDMKVDYPNLKTGDVVSNTTFNGVFVTKLQKSNNPTFDADLAKLKSDTIASFRAFELDHPEVFWLTGSIKLRVLTVTLNGVQVSHIFMTLVDDGGFTMRIADYAAAGAIEAGIQQRDAAVNAIIAQIPAGASTREKIANLNKWFTLNNEYNRSADLSAIGYTPHRSLKSLTSNEGVNGPVCDGYSRGFKTVCDRLGIPVLLDTGVASIGSHSELHMWMRVQVDGVWYGMDTTWNDPIVKGINGKVSGYENEKYMLVGDDTVVDGAKFGVSHPHNDTPGGTTGVLFAALVLNTDAITGYTPLEFEDVRMTDWFYDYVQKAAAKGLMGGTAEGIFSPMGTATRGQIVQILYNAAGQPAVDEVKVDGWFGKAATWAMNKGIVAGYTDGDFHGNDSVTREQLATILWAYDGAPAQEGELDFADADKVSAYAVSALLWAKNEGIIGGKPGNLVDPKGTATRAEIATIFSNYIK